MEVEGARSGGREGTIGVLGKPKEGFREGLETSGVLTSVDGRMGGSVQPLHLGRGLGGSPWKRLRGQTTFTSVMKANT